MVLQEVTLKSLNILLIINFFKYRSDALRCCDMRFIMTVNQLVAGSISTAGASKIETLADTARCFFMPTFSYGPAVAVIIDIYRLFFIFHGD